MTYQPIANLIDILNGKLKDTVYFLFIHSSYQIGQKYISNISIYSKIDKSIMYAQSIEFTHTLNDQYIYITIYSKNDLMSNYQLYLTDQNVTIFAEQLLTYIKTIEDVYNTLHKKFTFVLLWHGLTVQNYNTMSMNDMYFQIDFLFDGSIIIYQMTQQNQLMHQTLYVFKTVGDVIQHIINIKPHFQKDYISSNLFDNVVNL